MPHGEENIMRGVKNAILSVHRAKYHAAATKKSTSRNYQYSHLAAAAAKENREENAARLLAQNRRRATA